MFYLFLLLPLAGISYVSWHVWQLLPLAPVWRWLAVAVLVAWLAMLFVNLSGVLDRLPFGLAATLYEVGNASLFVLLYVVMAFIVLDVGRLVGLVPRQWLFSNGRTAMALAAIITAIFAYGYLHYLHKTRVELTLTTAKPLQRPLKVVMLSDLHLGYHNRLAELQRWIRLINAERPDLVLIAGDVIDGSMRAVTHQHMARELRTIEAPVVACLGNHEYYGGHAEALAFYRQAGITLLADSVATMEGIHIVGRDDRTNRHRQSLGRLMKGVDGSRFTILLDHQPYHLEQAERQGVDFQLSGHTHYGQVWPVSWVEDAIYECAFGQHQRGATRYYVTSGMGIWGAKFRIGTRSEYVVATIRNQN